MMMMKTSTFSPFPLNTSFHEQIFISKKLDVFYPIVRDSIRFQIFVIRHSVFRVHMN